MSKISMEVLKPWIRKRVEQLMGFEDDIVIEFAISQLDVYRVQVGDEKLDPYNLQMNLTGFLAEHTPKFCEELWNLLLSAQNSGTGVPEAFLEERKRELAEKKVRVL
jgi:serine/arginine repetitive matrix protein 1